jgi:hypothetical protein
MYIPGFSDEICTIFLINKSIAIKALEEEKINEIASGMFK